MLKNPAAQLVHDGAPVALYFPAMQGLHVLPEVALGEGLYMPAAHAVQPAKEVKSVELPHLPAGHG